MKGRGTSLVRRARFGFMSAVLLASVGASVVLANMLATRYRLRIDTTQTGEHRLSPRTRSILERAKGKYEIVIAADLKATDRAGRPMIDPRARRQAENVLEEMSRLNRDIRVTWIDTSSSHGPRELKALLDRLLERDLEVLSSQLERLRAAGARLEEAATFIETDLARSMVTLSESVTGVAGLERDKEWWKRIGEATAPGEAANIMRVVEAARAALPEGDITGWPLPEIDVAAEKLRPELRRTAGTLEVMSSFVGEIAARTDVPEETRAGARALIARIDAMRDSVATSADDVARLRAPDLLRVARVIQSQDAAIVVGPPEVGLTAIDMPALFPPTEVLDQAEGMRTNLGLRAEELISTALSSLTNPVKPIVVLMHGENSRLIDNWQLFGLAVERLRLRGMDVVEWAVALEETRPSLTALDPRGERPVVYVCHNTYATLLSPGESGQSGRDRAISLGDALARLSSDGERILLSVSPSPLPSLGIPDPTTAFLNEWGVEVETGRPLLHEVVTAGGRIVSPDFLVRAGEESDRITGAILGLDTALPWPCAIRRVEGSGASASVTPLLRVTDEGAWAEAKWEAFYNTPREHRASLADQPRFDADRDERDPPWVLAAALERDHDAGRQRLVVVGSNGWFVTGIVGLQRSIDGRAAPLYPGNAELLEASVYWLAGQDEMILPTAIARAVPRVKQMEAGQIEAMQWFVMAGLPGAVLAVGLVWRVLRG